MITMRVGGAGQLKAELALVREQLEPEVLTMTIQAAKLAMGAAVAGTPTRTGRTRAGYFLNVIGGSHRGRGVMVVLDHEYNTPGKFPKSDRKLGYSLLELLEYGTRAHPIYPTGDSTSLKQSNFGPGLTRLTRGRFQAGKNFLRFVIGGRVIFTRRVSHPGTKAYAMMRTAAVVGDQAFADLVVGAVGRLLAKVCGGG